MSSATELEVHLAAELSAQVADEQAELARFKEAFSRRQELLNELIALRRARTVASRRSEALERRIRREQQRAVMSSSSVDGSRRGRPVRIEVDDAAWEVLKREAVRQQRWLVAWLGEAIQAEVDAVEAKLAVGRPSQRRRRSPGERDPLARRRFIRVDVDDDHWQRARAIALDLDLTVGRYVGELAEEIAYRHGWRAHPPA